MSLSGDKRENTAEHSPAHRAESAAGSLGAAALRLAMRSAGLCVLRQNTQLAYTEAENLPAPLRAKWRQGCGDADLFAPETAAALERIKRNLLAGGRGASLDARLGQRAAADTETKAETGAELEAELRALAELPAAPFTAGENGAAGGQNGFLRSGPGDIWLRLHCAAERSASGEICAIVMAGEDISELRAREEVLRVLLREVSHRSKNLLAIIQSIAAQTARFSPDISVFLKKFRSRLHSLAASQDLVTESDWHGARLKDLLEAQTRFYRDCAQEGCAVSFSGENPYLFPSAALNIGLALHELAINSAAYGVLGRNAGRISVSCAAEKSGLRLRWREELPAAEGQASAEAAARFGSLVLERIVPTALEGAAQYSIKNGIIDYSIAIPAGKFR